MIQVCEINYPSTLQNYRLVWKALLSQTRGATFFQSFDWLTTYWQHFGQGQRLRILVVYSNDTPVGILPLVVRTRGKGLRRVRVLTYPLDNWGSHYGPIGPNPTATLLAALKHIRRTERDWDLIELPWIDGTADGGRTMAALNNAGFAAVEEPWEETSVVDLSAYRDWETYWASRTSRWRNNVRRSEKKLAEAGEVTYLRYRPAGGPYGQDDPRWELYESCTKIAAASWQADSASGTTLSHPSIRPFLKDCHEMAARTGGLDLNLLYLDGQPVAFNYAYHCDGHVYGLRTGFDRTATADGAGSVLQARMIADSFIRGDHTYDLGPGYTECKRFWCTQAAQSTRYTHFASRSPWAQLVRVKREAERVFSRKPVASDAAKI